MPEKYQGYILHAISTFQQINCTHWEVSSAISVSSACLKLTSCKHFMLYKYIAREQGCLLLLFSSLIRKGGKSGMKVDMRQGNVKCSY